MIQSVVSIWKITIFSAGVFGFGFLAGWARERYGSIINALRALKKWVKDETGKMT